MTAMATPRHRVSAAVARMREAADAVTDASVWSMDPNETKATLVEVTRLEAQVAELKARVLAHAVDLKVGEDEGATSTATWWAHTTRQVRPAATRRRRPAPPAPRPHRPRARPGRARGRRPAGRASQCDHRRPQQAPRRPP